MPAWTRISVDHRGHAGGDQLLGRDTVDVFVVDHGDLAGLDAPQEMLRAGVDARPPGDGPSTSSEWQQAS